MEKQKAPFVIRSKIWVEDGEGSVVFGTGRYRLLESIRRLGSMNEAAKEMKMSYRAVWLRIRSSEQRMGKALVIREGNGSRLTPFAESLMKCFKRMHTIVKSESDEAFATLMADHLS